MARDAAPGISLCQSPRKGGEVCDLGLGCRWAWEMHRLQPLKTLTSESSKSQWLCLCDLGPIHMQLGRALP